MATNTEISRAVSILDDLQKGECWIGYNAMQVLYLIDERVALKKAYEAGNSIWQLVNHISYWRNHLGKRLLAGQEIPFEGPDFYQPAVTDAEAWAETLHAFDKAYENLRGIISDLDPEKLDQPLYGENTEYTYYKQVMGAMQHDAFHLGQIMLIKRMNHL